jgi:molecular chaperone GrpE
MDEEYNGFKEVPPVEEGEAEELETDVVSLQKALGEERDKANGYLANWQRSQADFLNYKKRTEQDRYETAKHANAILILALLPVLDDLERALENVPEKLAKSNWVDGIELIYRKFKSILEGHGLSEIQAIGEAFDPNLHEAMLFSEGEEEMVVEEMQKGYRLHDQVLRPTKVSVGKGSEENYETLQEGIKEENNG